MMTKFSGPLLAVALALPAGCLAQTTTWELGHPDAKLLMGIDLKGLRDSAAGQAARAQWKSQPQAMGPAGFAMGFLEQVDSIFISSPSLSHGPTKAPVKTPGKTAAPAAENPPFLVVVEGTLPVQQLLAFLPGTSHRYHEVDIFRGAKANDASIAALDAHTIVLGDEKSVLAAIDRRGHPLAPASALMKRAQALASTHEAWLIIDDSLSKFQPAGSGLPNALAEQIAAQIKGLDVGLSVHDGFQFEMSLATVTEDVAGQMGQMLATQIGLMMQSPTMTAQANSVQAAEMLKRLHIDTDGAHLRIRFALSQAEFAEQLRGAQASLAARQSAQGAAQPTVQSVRMQPRPAPGKVKIYGLDEGVREIQLTH